MAHDASEPLSRNIDVLIVDTAGRLHTQDHLMRELEKIKRVIKKRIPGAPHEALLVLDATNGQNAIRQAEDFAKISAAPASSSPSSTAPPRGASSSPSATRSGFPIKFIGVGEQIEDIEPFDADTFVEALFEQPAGTAQG